MRKVRRDPRKGSVIEFAVLIMMVIFGLGLLLTGSGLIQTSQTRRTEDNFNTRLQLDAIGEEFCQAVRQAMSKEEPLAFEKENCEISGAIGEQTITLIYNELTVVLTKVEGVDNTYTVTAWTYGK